MLSESTTSPTEQLRVCRSQMEQLERENGRVVVQLKEVMKMNTHWQRYDAQREEHVVKLTRTYEALQDKILDLERQLQELNIDKSDRTEKGKTEADDDTIPEAATVDPSVNKATGRDATSSMSALRNEEEIAALLDHIAELKERILVLGTGRKSRRKDDEEELMLLREQVDVCVEDFQKERKDRERIHGENDDLLKRLAQAEKRNVEKDEQLFVYQEQIKQLLNRCPVYEPATRKGYEEPCCYPNERPQQYNYVPEQRRNTYRHPVYYGDDLTDLPRDVETDGGFDEPDNQTDGDTTNSATDTRAVTLQYPSSEREDRAEGDEKEGEPQTEEVDGSLECPRCQTSFGIHCYADLLDHIDKCVD